MQRQEFTIASAVDGLALSVLYMEPDNKNPKGIVQLVHGMSEYKERYIPFMEVLVNNGYACIIQDLRGHGKSVRSTADYGYMYEVGTDGVLEDVLQLNTFVKEKLPKVPLIMFAHSMGTLIARNLLQKHDDIMDVLILSGAPCQNPAVKVAKLLATLQKKVYGARHIAKMLSALSFAAYSSKFAKDGSAYSWISSEKAVVEAYDKDPACGFTFTLDGLSVLYDLLDRTFQKEGWACTKPKLPILFLAGEDDPCIGNKEKFMKEVNFIKSVGYRNVQRVLYEGMRHEILNETQKQWVYDDVLSYLAKIFGGKS